MTLAAERTPGTHAATDAIRSEPPVLACRRMADADCDAAVHLLASGFPERSVGYWRRALDRLRQRAVPADRPRYGYVMTDRGRIVGIILVLFAETEGGACRGNVSSWYVEPAYRGFSHLLLSTPLKLKGVTLFNISPAPHTRDTVEAQGFALYAAGSAFVIAALARPIPDARVRRVEATGEAGGGLLAAHAAWGCLCFEVEADGSRHAFVFAEARLSRLGVPYAQLVYCPGLDLFARFAGPLGRRLLRLGIAVVAVDANGPLAGLPGFYRAGRVHRVYRGAAPPRLGDLAYSELAVFGP